MAGIPRTLPEIIRRAIDAALADVHVAVPGQVVAYNPATGLADVQVMVQHSVWDDDNTRSYEDPGTLPGVPVMWPRAGGYLMTFPLAAGDTGLLIFNSDAIGEWRTSNQSSQPDDASRLSVGWPVFYPGLYADSNPFSVLDLAQRTAGLVLGKDGSNQQIQMPALGGTIDLGNGATDFVALASLVLARLNAIVTAFNSHTHSGVTTGVGTSGTPVATMATPTSVAATIARAK